ncbi:MAG: glycosyltransferase family 4 protein [Chitinophagaceae bacterium]
MIYSKPIVLIMTDWYEPGFKAGGPIQSCKNIVDAFREKFSFFILTSDRDLGDKQAYPGIETDTWLPLGEHVKIFYASPSYLDRRRFADIVREIKPEVVYFNSMFSLAFTLKPLWWLRNTKFRGRVILAPRGMLQHGALQKKTLKKKFFLTAFRSLGWHKQIIFHATDEQEEQDIQRFFSQHARIILAENIPNVDREPWQERMKIPGRLNCIFISRIHPKKNLHFALSAMKQVSENCNLLLDVYGEEDDMIYSMDCRKKAEAVGGNSSVSFYGPLPHAQVFTTLKKYHLFVLPTLGENFGHSIYEALSAGVPVLISDKTPWRRLDEIPAGFDLPLQEPSAFANKLEEFCKMDQEEYNKWSQGAKDYADQFTDRIDFYGRYISLFA